MNKIAYVLLVAVTALVSACSGGDSVLRKQIESGKKVCPMNMGPAGQLTTMDYDSDSRTVKFMITLNKSFADVKDLKADPDNARTSMALVLGKGDMNKLLKMMVEADASLQVVYKNRGGSDEFVLDFPASELKEIYDNPMSDEDKDKMLLSTQVNSEKKKVPYQIADGLTVTNVEDTGKAVVYTCEVDEDKYEIEDMANGVDDLKKEMKKMLSQRVMRNQAALLAGQNRGYEYRYVGKTSGREVLVAFTADELRAIGGK